ncbi:MAG: LamG domain-containing protein, partial [Candidatus Pacebacteria bacterium]|nr:LamG domain-containing protein [Candidatus Paceibacterota bacterium]
SYISKANFAKAQSFSSTVQTELLSDLVSEWTFDEDSGTTAKDTWGNNDGTVVGATYVPKSNNQCVYGGCYSFDGNDYINFYENYIFTNNHTLSFWAKINDQNYMGIVGGNLGLYSYLRFGKGEEREEIFGETDLNEDNIDMTFNSSIEYDKWYYFVITENDLNLWRLYVNGNLQTKAITTTNPNLTIRRIGQGRIGTDYLNGSIDDFRIYDVILTSSQIKQEYIAGLDSLLSKNIISQEEYDQRLNSLASK